MKKRDLLGDITDEKLFMEGPDRCLRGEEFIRTAGQQMDAIFRLAFSCLKSRTDADDVTQTVLLRLYERQRPFESDDHLRHWLIRVTLNECKRYWRSPWRRTEDFDSYAGRSPSKPRGTGSCSKR